ncbi:MAG: spondin domain-containing protein [Pirellulales bacterium]
MRPSSIVCSLLAAVCIAQSLAAAAIQYDVKFDATWSAATHPGAYPAGAHFSALIGGVHGDQVSFWTPGQLASAGIEQMAEIGGTSALRGEVQAAINAGTALSVIQGGGITSPGSTSVTVDVSQQFPLVTLVTMVAPSPDWFVGVHGLDLRNGAGWKDQLTVDLYAYDAGTEQGTGFSLSNPDTVPRQPIVLLGTPFAAGSPHLGTFTFTRIGVPEPATGVLAVVTGVVLSLRRNRRV